MPQNNYNSLIAPILIGSNQWWDGFKENELPAYILTTNEKKQFLQYPALRGVIQLLMLPIISAKLNFDGDEIQVQFLKNWFNRHYRRISRLMLDKALSWGYGVGEKIYAPIMIDGKNYIEVKGIIAPEPYNCELLFTDKPMGINSFKYWNIEVPREKIMYYAYKGDEICKPKGTSIVEDVQWAMDMLYKDWTMFQVYKKFKAISFLKLKYPADEQTKGSGGITDVNASIALALLEKSKESAGIILPRTKRRIDGTPIDDWEVDEISFSQKTGEFLDSINKLESLLYVGALVPRKIIEQEMTVGSYGLVEAQSDYFVTFVLSSFLEDYEEALRNWLIDPMLQDNFSTVKCGFNLKLGDETIKLLTDIVKEGIRTAMATPDYDEIMDMVGIPHKKDIAETSTIETEHKHEKIIEFQKREIRAGLQKRAKEWVNKINPKIIRNANKLYESIKENLTVEKGKIISRLNPLYKNNMVDISGLQKAVQLPRRLFSNTVESLTEAWNDGMSAVMSDLRQEKIDEPNLKGIRKIAVGWEGTDLISGEGEYIEQRLFKALVGINQNLEAIRIADTEFDQYINKLLPNRLTDIIHEACMLGVKDAISETITRRYQKMKTGE